MAQGVVAHFANDMGVKEIRIGLHEFMCMGATSPFDHPHIFIDMGKDSDAICPYCGTRFIYDPKLKANESQPEGALVAA
jgi:uncharacterized Zn-finger protein